MNKKEVKVIRATDFHKKMKSFYFDYAGLDGINRGDRIYELRSNDWWQVTYNQVWAATNSVACITSSISRVRMTSLGEETYNGAILTAQSESEDWLGNITRSSTYTDAANVTTWQVVDTPESITDNVQKSSAGYSVQTISTTSITNTFTYDGFARQVTATDGRTNTAITAYNDLGQVAYIEDAATNRSSFAYNNLGQRIAISNALGQVSHTAYNQRGQTIATWGTSYPVAYQFDPAGRMIAMATTRSNEYANVNLNTLVPTGEALSSLSTQNLPLDITRWYYDETTGLLTNKVYADGNGTVYTYTETGKIHTRVWARGKTATYTYGDLGQLTNVDYSDSTPDITYTHDRLGRILSAISSASTSTFHYDGLTLDYETQDGDIIDRKQDSFGRTIGYILTGGPSSPMTLTYSFDEYGRLFSVTSIIGTETNIFTYTYLQGIDLVNAMSSDSGVQWSRYYESELNLITAVSNSWDSTVISSFDYTNDPLGRRTHRADYYNGSILMNDFGYNIRGEVISAIMGNDNHSYSNDPIGNRNQSTVYSGQSTVTNVYTVNQLNQYTAITGGISASPTHDADGNLTWDGQQWAHSWDGENRLISSAPNYWDTTNGATRIDYTYDYMNRRVSKTVSMMAGRSISYPPSPSDPQGSWSALETRRYIWDGCNIATEIIIDQTAFTTNINYYTWGLDLSGTLQGAGGVGGLLAETKTTDFSTNTYYAVGDANGNMTEYIDSTGAVKAHYEYNAFGEITAQSGSMSGDFVFRFSTKYYDKKTGLYYYGYRYYDPVTGHWLSLDPIGEQGGVALYGFVDNNAICYVDPNGLFVDRLLVSLGGGIISAGISTATTLMTGGSARDALIAGGSSFVGGAVTGFLLAPPPLATPGAAGAVGGAVSSFIASSVTEYYRMKDAGEKPKVTLRASANVVASTFVGSVLGRAGGGLGDKISEVDQILFIPFRKTQFKLNINVEISGTCAITEASLGVTSRAVSVMQGGLNTGFDAALEMINRNNIDQDWIPIYERTEIKQTIKRTKIQQ